MSALKQRIIQEMPHFSYSSDFVCFSNHSDYRKSVDLQKYSCGFFFFFHEALSIFTSFRRIISITCSLSFVGNLGLIYMLFLKRSMFRAHCTKFTFFKNNSSLTRTMCVYLLCVYFYMHMHVLL